jgi:hypothetical protein
MERLLPRGLCYVNWDFGIPEFDGFELDFTIHSPMEQQPGMYFQLYDYPIGEIASYYGLQTDIEKPGFGGQGKGLLFSRWGKCSSTDARREPDGWLEVSDHEGDFVGIRRLYDWGAKRYCARLAVVDCDGERAWFGLSLRDLESEKETLAGCLRFPHGARIKNGGGTWIECYSAVTMPTGFPFFHVSLVQVVALRGNDRIPAVHARSTYANYPNVTQFDVSVDQATKRVEMRCGQGVSASRPAGKLF